MLNIALPIAIIPNTQTNTSDTKVSVSSDSSSKSGFLSAMKQVGMELFNPVADANSKQSSFLDSNKIMKATKKDYMDLEDLLEDECDEKISLVLRVIKSRKDARK